MSLAIGMPLVISAVQALLKYRGRVDEILASKEASEAIPFALPPAPIDFDAHRGDMLAFFESDQGRLILELNDRVDAFATLRANPAAAATFKLRNEFLQLFLKTTDTVPIFLGPQPDAHGVRASAEMRLTYYVVESHRLSRNPALTRLILATADTLLEVAGANADLFIANPKTQAIVRTLVDEFAGKRDFDDDSGELLFRSFLRAATVAALDNQGSISEEPALVALFAALSDMRKDSGDDFVAQILTGPGFQTLVGKYITNVADDPAFLIADGPFRTILSATLKDLAKNFDAIFDDPRALYGVLEVALTSAAGEAQAILARPIGGKPLLSAVLQSVLAEIQKRGAQDALLASFANGELVSAVFQASMQVIAASPATLAKRAKIDALSAELVAGLAAILAKTELTDVVAPQTLRAIASRSLLVLAENGAEWAGNGAFATALAADVLGAASSAVADGLTTDDMADLLDVAIRSASASLGRLDLDVHLEIVLGAVGEQLTRKGVRALLAPQSRQAVILASLETVARNPKVWSRFAEADLVQPLVAAAFQGLATDKTGLLAGPTMVEGLRAVLVAAALRGQALIDGNVDSAMLQKLLTLGLRKLEQELGHAIDTGTVADYLRALVEYFLDDPFELDRISDIDFKDLHELAMGRAELDEPGEPT